MKASPDTAGCWVAGDWGQYATGRVIVLASCYGYAPAAYDPDDFEQVCEEADAAEAWMNEHVAPEGYSFGWYDGEFFLWADNEWEMGL